MTMQRQTAIHLAGAVILALAMATASAMTTASALATAPQDTEKAVELTARAAELIEENRLGKALTLLEQAVEADDVYWEVYYQQGRIFGMREDFLLARRVLLKASQLNPGHAHTHRLAWEASYRIGDFENAWDQAIRASRAGVDMNQWFLEMYGKSDPPEDFEQRINAPRLYVAALDISEVEARAQMPFNRNPASGGIGSVTGRPAYTEGVNRANENAFNLTRVSNSVRDAVFDAPYLATVLDLEIADYVLGISVDSLSETEPVRMEGYLRLYEVSTGEAVYFKSLRLRDISSDAVLTGEILRQIVDLQEWTLR